MWKLIDDNAKDGRLVILLIVPDKEHWNPLEDDHLSVTIGYNTLADTGEDEWKFAGWCWSHDCYIDGNGTPIYYQEVPEIREALRNEFRPPEEQTHDIHDWSTPASMEVDSLPTGGYVACPTGTVNMQRGDYIIWGGLFRPANSQWFGFPNQHVIYRPGPATKFGP